MQIGHAPHLRVIVESIHLTQHLVEGLVALVIALGTTPAVAVATSRGRWTA
jgi:hypothetical protein